jgi:hypothetical protein
MRIDTLILENFFDEKEIDYITAECSAMDTDQYDDPVQVHNGTYYAVPSSVESLIDQKIPKLPNEILHVKFFDSTEPAGLHADTNGDTATYYDSLARTIIIPLDTYDCKTVVFHQELKCGENNNHIINFPILSDENDNVPDFFLHLLPHRDCLKRLSIETMFDWSKGSLLAFDRKRLHCSTVFSDNMTCKKGLVIWTVIKN